MIFLDTNVLMYASGADDSSLAKTGVARGLLRTTTGVVLSLQVLQEFYVNATRVTRRANLSHADACALIDSWRRFRIFEPTLATLDRALDIRERHKFSYWDAAVMAAALDAGCTKLLSEDWTHDQVIDGLALENPFRGL
ncbi:PIN domain-containing protein [Sphingomonas sp. SUN039]|uniref:PIN domain-containing protein n=1 Tax=Sphingomonas sp. SUN039 TaxID=2937787 RepID=UPI0021648E31|nr:PIN domain-containing protein [Sphingomonas sp. SUN039]UVO52774.1 PIN domain-containing protein [Sphingomonas sp. SUN039]